MEYNNKHKPEGSGKGEKFVRGLWVMWMTKLRVTVMKILCQVGDEHSQCKENMISFNT